MGQQTYCVHKGYHPKDEPCERCKIAARLYPLIAPASPPKPEGAAPQGLREAALDLLDWAKRVKDALPTEAMYTAAQARIAKIERALGEASEPVSPSPGEPSPICKSHGSYKPCPWCQKGAPDFNEPTP